VPIPGFFERGNSCRAGDESRISLDRLHAFSEYIDSV